MAQKREKEETELKVPQSIPLRTPNPPVSQLSGADDQKPPSPSSRSADLKLSDTDDLRSSSDSEAKSPENSSLKLSGTDFLRSSSEAKSPEKSDLKLSGDDDLRFSSEAKSPKNSCLKLSGTDDLRSSSAAKSPVKSDLKLSGTDDKKPADLKLSGTDDLRSPEKSELENLRRSLKRRREANRCSGIGCRRKVGLIGFRCRCGETFCSEHRYSDRHDCSYDYKAAGREAIARENPVVRAPKILKV